ncbi:MAG TPA: molybdenum cofactor biosynthesis protein MoaE [Asticcacaulis sp.]|nr:molybdenum cofactor biosynthesis protein MoaE [Asticcacaulis sp.]
MTGFTAIPRVGLRDGRLDPVTLFDAFCRAEGAAGAVASFTGVVRDEDGGVDYLYLDWYPGMSEASLQAIAQACVERFEVTALTVEHRCGKVGRGEAIVFVAAASKHRRAALEAVDYAMDRLKSEAALWKREVGPEVDRWVEPRVEDSKDLERWKAHE